MPNSKNNRKEPEKNRKGRFSEKASSFHGRIPSIAPAELRRPKTLPDLLPDRTVAMSPDARPKLTKLLLNVTIQGSLGAVQVVMSPENTVSDLITAAVRQYSKEYRRPILPSTDASLFDLHYSQFSLESLEREEKLMALGSRNFFLCTKKAAAKDDEKQTTSCSKEAEKVTKSVIPWLKFMNF
ncbi:hypothetical protein F3Y22_tig00110893pilonHSYRG00996 [Hibiscus syriacus]|uniref:DUF7054 domain-containing protein n=1 Tax=Hibiscus syriacus TaxID=106335 RepID=A0A6A2ZJA5_HIBSY|nr:uncharacterized protein LOC120145180 [Hibiscus syriacus]XP_039015002.1 uncharacterized protein LOC120145180 [Hibiscus syriacus]KAE8691045.1 hypothetical protein F3Y22_tig00110893pilonHSYRG00996 [Hibiscus syriacus]